MSQQPENASNRGADVAVGDVIELEIDAVAHGGHFVGRHQGRVVFVRHTAPGERVRAEVTKVKRSHVFAEATEVLHAHPQRTLPPCDLAHAFGCGGCDFQHLDLGYQRQLKARVLSEQLRRLAGIEIEVPVEQVSGDHQGLRWRTRMNFVDLGGGRKGLRKHRSHDVIEVDDCKIAHPDHVEPGRGRVRESVTAGGCRHTFQVDRAGFWQVHPGAPSTLVSAVLDMLAPQPGERVLDLYAGAGLFSAFLADAVGDRGRVVAVEGDRRAVHLAEQNLASLGHVSVLGGAVEKRWAHSVRALGGSPDLIVLDPPRAGAKRPVLEAMVAAQPRAIAYIACDPAALARDLEILLHGPYQLSQLRSFDLFPMTHHLESVALLERT